MGSISGRKALQVIGNVEKILAIELLTAAQAFEFRKPLKSGKLLEEVHRELRKKVTFAQKDRVFSLDIEKGIEMIRDAALVTIVNKVSDKENLSLATPYSEEFDAY
jgi:histidine ammonia-lyase